MRGEDSKSNLQEKVQLKKQIYCPWEPWCCKYELWPDLSWSYMITYSQKSLFQSYCSPQLLNCMDTHCQIRSWYVPTISHILVGQSEWKLFVIRNNKECPPRANYLSCSIFDSFLDKHPFSTVDQLTGLYISLDVLPSWTDPGSRFPSAYIMIFSIVAINAVK